MASQSLPASSRKLPDTQRQYPRHIQQPSPTYQDSNRSPTSWILTDKQDPPAYLPAYSLGASFLRPENQGISHKRSSLRTVLETPIHALYHCFLLSLPMLYTSRITRLSNQVDVSMPEIKQSVLEMAAQAQPNHKILRFLGPNCCDSHDAPMLHKDLKYAWGSFIDSLVKEWRMLNVIAILLLSAIVAILQIQSAANDPFTLFSGLLSLTCVFISVSFGCMCSIQFDSMRETRKAVEWTLAAQNTKMSTFWNIYILLAMPVIWLAWSILLYLVCFLSFVWRTGTILSSQSPPTITAHDILGPRIMISVIIALGLTCFVLILTTFRQYGDAMDNAWNLRVLSWLSEAHTSREQIPRQALIPRRRH